MQQFHYPAYFLERANELRTRAEEVATRAETMNDAVAREKLFRIAELYSTLAERLEGASS